MGMHVATLYENKIFTFALTRTQPGLAFQTPKNEEYDPSTLFWDYANLFWEFQEALESFHIHLTFTLLGF